MRRTCFLVALAAAACDSSSDVGPDAAPDTAASPDAFVDQSGPLFEPNHIVQVAVTMAEADWDAMRVQTRTFDFIEGACLSQPPPSPFTTFHASITVDGASFADVGVKKKGFFGSLDATKPSLKIKLDEYVVGQEYLGLEKLTLNNSHQDPSFVRTCLAYEVFSSAGIVAPRCNFAHVTVNGRDMGIYVNVETIDHHMTKSRYADGTGNIYEGTLSDFRKYWTGTFDGKGGGDGTDLTPVANVVDGSLDSTFVSDLAQYIDVDKFINYWATEILTNHWDGYANDRNNYFVYHDPTTNKLDFIPWGPDGALQPNATFGPLGSTTGPVAVAANGAIPYRLFSLPGTKQQFLDRQRALLSSIWNEATLLAEVNRMETLITPIENAYEGTAWHANVDGVRNFVNNRRATLTAALDAGPTWTDPLPGYPCLEVVAHVTGS
ncbi:MAG TPA: CotH kinase family protein, partial [Kofleriaceae bacterium]|nr:CotH kinase family protein [Kofleriaceae bacterium]